MTIIAETTPLAVAVDVNIATGVDVAVVTVIIAAISLETKNLPF